MKLPGKNVLAREITLILAIKLILLFALWFAFFRHPITDGLTGSAVGRVIVGDMAPAPTPRR